jgi:hypothetical protein
LAAAEAAGLRTRPGRRRRPQSLARNICASVAAHKRELGNPAMRGPQGRCRGQKKGSIRRWSLRDRTEVQIQSRADGRGRRIRHLPMDPRLGRRIRLGPVVADLAPREEETVQVTSTKRIWMQDRSAARWATVCQPCAPCREGSVWLPRTRRRRIGKNSAPLEGRAGPSRRRQAARGGGTDADPREEEEKAGAVDGACMVEGPGQQPARMHASHAASACGVWRAGWCYCACCSNRRKRRLPPPS